MRINSGTIGMVSARVSALIKPRSATMQTLLPMLKRVRRRSTTDSCRDRISVVLSGQGSEQAGRPWRPNPDHPLPQFAEQVAAAVKQGLLDRILVVHDPGPAALVNQFVTQPSHGFVQVLLAQIGNSVYPKTRQLRAQTCRAAVVGNRARKLQGSWGRPPATDRRIVNAHVGIMLAATPTALGGRVFGRDTLLFNSFW